MRYGQLVIGPAGSGKSTYCSTIVQHALTENKTVHVVNLDPAAEYFDYDPMIDIRELIHIDDVMEEEELKYGPNGGLVYCMEYLLENIEWLQEKLGEDDDDYILFDCPGQIELYTHMDIVKKLAEHLKNWNFMLCSVYIVDSQFMVDGAKFLSGTMSALSVMVNLELPHINLLSKIDLISKSSKHQLDSYLEPDPHVLLSEVHAGSRWSEKYTKLTESIGRLIEDFSLFGEDEDVKGKDVDLFEAEEDEKEDSFG